MDTYSQIVSNFKVFSKNGNAEPIQPNKIIGGSGVLLKPSIESARWIIVFVILVVGVVYYKRTELIELLNSTFYKFLLKTHITSSGELASTYVPQNILSVEPGSTGTIEFSN
jgi:hypothetical protein